MHLGGFKEFKNWDLIQIPIFNYMQIAFLGVICLVALSRQLVSMCLGVLNFNNLE